MFHIVLFEPEIPPNTGNIIRLAANTGCTLHLVEPLGFAMEDRLLRRAGLDYHETASVQRHADWAALLQSQAPHPERMFALSRYAAQSVYDTAFQAGDWLVFGPETRGLPVSLRQQVSPAQTLRLPMRAGQRSLNLSNAVTAVVYEAWRQNDFHNAAP